MAFAFEFDQADLEDENDIPGRHGEHQNSISRVQQAPSDLTNSLVQPQRHTFAEFLESLPSQVSYNLLDIPNTKHEQTPAVKIPRRSLFDIRQQLMWEADPAADTSSLLEGLATGDLQQGTYEGGFKTWECSVDLAQLLMHHDLTSPMHIIEMGAGSAVPALLLLKQVLQHQMQDASKPVRFTLCDYNVDVLRLCTAVNVFLVLVLDLGAVDLDGELEITDEQKEGVLNLLSAANVDIDFVSGAWGSEFCSLLDRESNVTCLLLASETVYSPTSMDAFTSTVVLNLQIRSNCTALVAAKKVYFGVGGGIAEFEASLKKHNATALTVVDVPGSGVGRVVLDVRLIS